LKHIFSIFIFEFYKPCLVYLFYKNSNQARKPKRKKKRRRKAFL